MNSSLLLRFVEGIVRPHDSSNQHFNKSNITNVLHKYSPLLKKIYLTFYDTNNYKNGKNNSCAASIFNETHIFRRESSILISTEKRKEEKL